jgi:hypothetical protein
MLNWRDRLECNPFGTMAALAAVILGCAGLISGDRVSAGMTNSLRDTANIVAHLWGGMFALGGALKLWGLYWYRSTVEIPGLWLMIAGYAFYALTVTAGLGMHGMAAGVLSTALCAGCLLKVRLIMRHAKAAPYPKEDAP